MATPALIIPLVAAAESRWTIEEIAIYVAAFGAVAHHLPGMMRAYGDRELSSGQSALHALTPILIVRMPVFAYWHLNGLRVIFLLWGAWHALAQVYGFVRIYDARRGSFAPLTATVGLVDVSGLVRLGAILFARADGVTVGRLLRLRRITDSRSSRSHLSDCLGHGHGPGHGAFLINGWWQRREGQPANPIKVLLMATSFGFWYYAMVGINNVLLGIALFEIFHDVQYLSIVWLYNRRRVDKGYGVGAFTRFLFRRSGVLIGLYVGLVFAYGDHSTAGGYNRQRSSPTIPLRGGHGFHAAPFLL